MTARLLAAGLLLAATAHAQVEGIEHVVVIGVDGMSPDGVQKAPTPHLNRMIAEGAHSMHARAVLPSSSSPNWASMIMGAGPEQHGITSNDWRLDNHVLSPTATSTPGGHFPTVFHLLKTQRPGAQAVAVYDWDGFGRLFDHADVALAVHEEGPEATAIRAVAELAARRPAITFVHLDHVDGAGHGQGHGSDAYYEAVVRADTLVGYIRAGIEATGLTDRTLVIVTADHGGLGSGHGGESLAEMEIPWIAVGPGVTPGKRIGDAVDTYDTAATVAYALGLDAPQVWIGRPVRDAFAPGGATGYVPAPRVVAPQGLTVGTGPRVTMSLDGDGVIRYTLDGTDPTDASPAYTAPFRLDRTATVTARAFRDGAASDPSARFVRTVSAADAAGRGLSVGYYGGEGADWPRIPDLDAMTPEATTEAPEFSLATLDRAHDEYALRFEGTFRVDTAGTYTFWTHSDDGSRLVVDGRAAVDNDGHHGPRVEQGEVDLAVGEVPLRLDYFNGGGGQFLEVWVEGPGLPRQVVPVTRLTPARAGG